MNTSTSISHPLRSVTRFRLAPNSVSPWSISSGGHDWHRFNLGKGHVVKVARENEKGPLLQEKVAYERLGIHQGIIHCSQASDDAIEMAYAEHGNLEQCINEHPEPSQTIKAKWIKSLADALAHVHSRRVLIDDMACRNVVVTGDQELKLMDFGQSYVLPLDTDMDTVCHDRLTVKIEMTHLGWMLYSISVWKVHKYYYWSHEPPQWPSPEDLPPTDGLFSGTIVRKCWRGEYLNAQALSEDIDALLGEGGGLCTEDLPVRDTSSPSQ
ncbi:hypothetical protein LZ554_007112 [Drepanopeziza brunnea f. sp. 'monogermtubi']|nr:hypothetical protein LZ554_007112 [Drepanopeziza brunnea f. sp. 'monogermtubi']